MPEGDRKHKVQIVNVPEGEATMTLPEWRKRVSGWSGKHINMAALVFNFVKGDVPKERMIIAGSLGDPELIEFGNSISLLPRGDLNNMILALTLRQGGNRSGGQS